MKHKTATLVVYARIHLSRVHVKLFLDDNDVVDVDVVVLAADVGVAAVVATVGANVVVDIVLMKKVPCFKVVEKSF